MALGSRRGTPVGPLGSWGLPDCAGEKTRPAATAGQGARLTHARVSLVPYRSQEPPQDSVIATYEEHEDSVYAVDWSSADPWLFASLSYDGRLVINRVPRALKYHILL